MQLLYQPEWHPGTPMTQQKGALMHAPQLQADVRAHGAASAPAAHAHAAATPVPSPHAFTSASLRSVPLRAAAAAAWPNAKLLPSPVVRVCNYPPSDLSSFAAQAAGQQFYWSPVAWQIGLHENCSLLHTRVGCSGVLPAGRAGLGLFAGRAFAEGATIGYMWGRFATQEEWDSICHGGVELYPYHSARLGEMAENFVAPVQNGIHRCVAVPYQEHGATLLLASEQCPMAYMNHGDTAAARNVRIAVPATAFSWRDQPAYQYVPCIVRTSHGRGIAAGDELLTNYEWTTADLNRLTARFAKQHDTRSIVLAQGEQVCRTSKPFGSSNAQWHAGFAGAAVPAAPQCPSWEDLQTSCRSSTSSAASSSRVTDPAVVAGSIVNDAVERGEVPAGASMPTRYCILPPEFNLIGAEQYQRLCQAWCTMAQAEEHITGSIRSGGTQLSVPLSHPLREHTEMCLRWGLRYAIGSAAARALHLVDMAQLRTAPNDGPMPLHTDMAMMTAKQRQHAARCYSVILFPHDCQSTILPRLSGEEQDAVGLQNARVAAHMCRSSNFTTYAVTAGTMLVFRGDMLHASPKNRSTADRIAIYAMFSTTTDVTQFDAAFFPVGFKHTVDLKLKHKAVAL